MIKMFVASFFDDGRKGATLRLACNFFPGLRPATFDASSQDGLVAKLEYLLDDLGS